MFNDYVSVEKMKYKKDKLSYALALIGLCLNICYFITLYKNNGNHYYTYKMGISVIYNLLFMLGVFLAAENAKAYRRKYSFVLLVIGVLQFVRIFIYPLQSLNAEALSSKQYLIIICFLSLSGIILIASAIVSLIKSTILKRFVEGKLIIENSK